MNKSPLGFTPQQIAAIDQAVAWYKDPRSGQVFKLFGYAGTGKTTLAKAIADALGVVVYFVAPTGKAAAVLTNKDCEATTIHRLIYKPSGSGISDRVKQLRQDVKAETDRDRRRAMIREIKQLTQPGFTPNEKSALAEADPTRTLVILDEASMVDTKVGRDLASFGIKILALGDPAQLPPVNGTPFFKGKPDVLLTELHRSEADSPVTHFATQVRRDGRMSGRVGTSGIRYKFACSIETRVFLQFDQVIVHTNERRRAINNQIRAHLGRDPFRPERGDRLIGLKNNYDLEVLNGEQYDVLAVKDRGSDYLLKLRVSGTKDELIVPACKETFLDDEDLPRSKTVAAFTWGFAITGHKSQGSQWRRVLVLAEKFSSRTAGWLYTAVTRASERVVVITPPR